MIEMLTLETSFYELKDQFLTDNSGGSVVLLGKEFIAPEGQQAKSAEVKAYVTSRLWFTYRRYFPPIGGTGPSSDQGWGCMMRCAQMLMGEVLLRRHICSHWEWPKEKATGDYLRILQMFDDNKNALYSIHQIAQMSVSEGKQLAEWIGPNTAAQVLKKLSIFDCWSDIAVHVALDSLLVDDDVHLMATTRPDDDFRKIVQEDGKLDGTLGSVDDIEEKRKVSMDSTEWRSTLIIIPLRLGLTTANPLYLPAIQGFFRLPQCVGILGGRPNHALYFIGIKDDKMIYLDPHYTQNCLSASSSSGSFDKDGFIGYDDGFEHASEATEESTSIGSDSTFHCPTLLWMDYKDVDPSLAMAFFCKTKSEYEDLSKRLKEGALKTTEKYPVFEHIEKRPSKWPKFVPYVGVKAHIQMNEFLDMGEPNYEQDDAFEVLE